MIPLLRIYFDKQSAKHKKCYGTGDFKPAPAVHFALQKFISRIKRPIYKVEFIKMARRYAEMVSGNVDRTMSPFQDDFNNGYGRVLHTPEAKNRRAGYYFEIERYRYDGKFLNYLEAREGLKVEFCYIEEGAEIIKQRKLDEKYLLTCLRFSYKWLPKYTRKVSWLHYCESCGKCHKVSKYNTGDNCRSCTAKVASYKRNKKEVAEVNRLLHKLKRVIKNESERLEKEAC